MLYRFIPYNWSGNQLRVDIYYLLGGSRFCKYVRMSRDFKSESSISVYYGDCKSKGNIYKGSIAAGLGAARLGRIATNFIVVTLFWVVFFTFAGLTVMMGYFGGNAFIYGRF